jgi:hypothetical protein
VKRGRFVTGRICKGGEILLGMVVVVEVGIELLLRRVVSRRFGSFAFSRRRGGSRSVASLGRGLYRSKGVVELGEPRHGWHWG